MLERWSQWSISGLTQEGYEDLPHRDNCGEDKDSPRYWFVGAPNTTTESWNWPFPAGRSLVLVPVNMSMTGGVECTPEFRETVGTAGEATFDGQPVAVSWAWPVDQQPEIATCALWGTTEPLTAGPHTVELTSEVAVGGKVTVAITAR